MYVVDAAAGNRRLMRPFARRFLDVNACPVPQTNANHSQSHGLIQVRCQALTGPDHGGCLPHTDGGVLLMKHFQTLPQVVDS